MIPANFVRLDLSVIKQVLLNLMEHVMPDSFALKVAYPKDLQIILAPRVIDVQQAQLKNKHVHLVLINHKHSRLSV
jgi:hypothetical protein